MPIDQRYYAPRTPVSVICIGDGVEALLIRAILESLNAVVQLHLIGTPEDFLLTVVRDENDPKFVVICGHGDENGLVFGELGDEIDDGTLIAGSLTPDAIRSRAKMAGAVVLSTACLTGTASFSAAFIDSDAAAYIASSDYPDGADVPLFVHLFFHSLLHRGCDAQKAFEQARSADTEFQTFRFQGIGAKTSM